MRIIELDARGRLDDDDVYDALSPALEAPAWHGRNMNALIDSVGTGSVNYGERREIHIVVESS